MKFSKIATFFVLTIAALISCDSDDSSTPEQPVIPGNLSGELLLSADKVDFGSFEIKESELAAKIQDPDTTVTLTLINETSLILNKVSAEVSFDGGGAGVELSVSPLSPGDSLDVPFTYKVTTTTPGMYTGEAKLTPTFENDSIGEPLVVALEATLE